jgi:hypothetical protein
MDKTLAELKAEEVMRMFRAELLKRSRMTEKELEVYDSTISDDMAMAAPYEDQLD